MTNNEYELLLATAIDEYAYAACLDTYELLYVNDALCNQMNITKEDWEGKKCYEVMRLAKRPCVFCSKDYISMNETYSRYRYKRNRDLHFITKDKIIECEKGKVLIQTSYDVSDQFMKIKVLQSELHLNQAIIACAKTLLNDGSVQVNISKLLKIVCDYFGGVRANVFEYNIVEDIVECNYQYQVNNSVPLHEDTTKLEAEPLQVWWNILDRNEVVYIPSVKERFSKESHEYEVLTQNGITSCIVHSIKIESKIAGFVIIENPTIIPESFDLLDTSAIFIANNLEKNRTVCHLESSVDSVGGKIDINNILLECADILFEGTDVTITINRILEKICEYFDADRLSLLELSEEGTGLCNTYEFANKYAQPFIHDMQGKELPIPEFLYDDMLNHSTVFINLDDPDFDENSVDYKILLQYKIPSIIMTNLLKKGEFSGLLAVHYPKKNVENRDLLHTISGFILSEISKREIVKELEALSFTDKLTGQFNRNFYLHSVEKYQKEATTRLGIIFADINGLKRANDNLGHEYGDALIKWCGHFLAKHNPNSVYRIGGDEFVCFIENMECEEFFDHIQKMRLELHDANLPNMSMGGTWSDSDEGIDKQIIETDKIMYLEKQKYYILKQITQIKPEDELEVLRKLLEPII